MHSAYAGPPLAKVSAANDRTGRQTQVRAHDLRHPSGSPPLPSAPDLPGERRVSTKTEVHKMHATYQNLAGPSSLASRPSRTLPHKRKSK